MRPPLNSIAALPIASSASFFRYPYGGIRYIYVDTGFRTDCDPGHDDAIAILLAIHIPNLQLLGVSTCHGNAKPKDTHVNAVRLLHAFNAPVDVHAHRGAVKPLLRPARTDPEIHGDDGLGGADGLPTLDDPAVVERWQLDGQRSAVDGMAKALKSVQTRYLIA